MTDIWVKFYKDMKENPKRLPGHWPAIVIENADRSPSESFIRMSAEDYATYRLEHWVENKKETVVSPVNQIPVPTEKKPGVGILHHFVKGLMIALVFLPAAVKVYQYFRA